MSIKAPKNQDSFLFPRPSPRDFNLQKMEDIYTKAQGQSDQAHRHDYFTILLIEKARGEHIIDFQVYELQPKQVHFVGPGQVHQVNLSEKPQGWVITFSPSFLVESNIPESFIHNLNLFRSFGEHPPLEIDSSTLDKLLKIVLDMKDCLPEELLYRKRALGALLQLFLIFSNNSCTLNFKQMDEDDPSICLLRDFKKLLSEKYAQSHKVTLYASELNISPKHLSQTVKNLTGKTAKEFISDRLILEAKRLLKHSSLSVKEIAYQIGFEEPLHFSAFFKKIQGISPSEYRQGT